MFTIIIAVEYHGAMMHYKEASVIKAYHAIAVLFFCAIGFVVVKLFDAGEYIDE